MPYPVTLSTYKRRTVQALSFCFVVHLVACRSGAFWFFVRTGSEGTGNDLLAPTGWTLVSYETSLLFFLLPSQVGQKASGTRCSVCLCLHEYGTGVVITRFSGFA
jgi:hypothetical protein